MRHPGLWRRLVATTVAAAGLAFVMLGAADPGVPDDDRQGRARPEPPTPAKAWMDRTLPPDRRADMVIAQMTLDEKIQLLHGGGPASAGQPTRSNGGAGWVPGIPRLGIPDIDMADSAVGVARGAAMARYSTLLPSTLGLAATWDRQAARLYGSVIGRELRDQGYNMSIGGGVNITREPRNGRTFEYAGEDPILAGTTVGNVVKGVQEQGVMGDLKHFALNDQETGRSIGNVLMDRRVMRETDLLAFEVAHRISGAAAVMCAYNKIDGEYACENDYTLNRVLKKAFGFKGWVLSDWGGTHSTKKAIVNGLDQEMPGSTYFGGALKKAVEAGDVPKARIDEAVHRILRSMFATGVVDRPPVRQVPDVFRGLDDAQRLAEQSIVLLQNAGGVLPLGGGTKSIAVIGGHADVGVPSGGGSAQVNPPGGNAVRVPATATGRGGASGGIDAVYFPSSPLKAIRTRAPNARVRFADGADPAAAAALAKTSEVAIVFAVQPMSEGRDATTLALPGGQDTLITQVAAANPRTIVVLETGGPVSMPWTSQVAAVLEAWFPGSAGGPAIANVLFGSVNPAARLAVTFPASERDLPHPEIAGMSLTPAQAPVLSTGDSRDGRGGRGSAALPPFDIPYTEGLRVGYKWFDAQNKQPLFPFGFGLSYTTFAYSGLSATAAGRDVTVRFTVANSGQRAGVEVAQVYLSLPRASGEPPKRLVGWERVELQAGAAKVVSLTLDPWYLSVFSVEKDGWDLLPGEYQVLVGGSSRNTPLAATVHIGGSGS